MTVCEAKARKGARSMNFIEKIKKEATTLTAEWLQQAKLMPGEIVVIGCSTSEVQGEKIGTTSSPEVAEALYEAIMQEIRAQGLWAAFQCCEHLNRALVIEQAAYHGTARVNVVPHYKAGGAMATTAYRHMESPIVVEYLQAAAGLDIGDTFIGMHLRPVAVPVRLSGKAIGSAHVTAARTRFKCIGGERAQYDPDLA